MTLFNRLHLSANELNIVNLRSFYCVIAWQYSTPFLKSSQLVRRQQFHLPCGVIADEIASPTANQSSQWVRCWHPVIVGYQWRATSCPFSTSLSSLCCLSVMMFTVAKQCRSIDWSKMCSKTTLHDVLNMWSPIWPQFWRGLFDPRFWGLRGRGGRGWAHSVAHPWVPISSP